MKLLVNFIRKIINSPFFPVNSPSLSLTGFTTKEDLIKVLKQDYARNGVVLSIKRSNSTGVILKCDLGGSPNMVERAEPKRK